MLSALGRLQRAGRLSVDEVTGWLTQVAASPIRRHQLASLLDGAWKLRYAIWLLDGLYVALATRLEAPLITTDAALAKASPVAELVSSG